MFERWFTAYCLALRTWWLTSRFLTYQYRMTLVDSRKSQPLAGMLAVDSYLGSRLLGRSQDEVLELEIFNQRRCFVITEIIHQSQPPHLVCSCMLCQ
ncbi:hypothetical protein CGI77_21645 [Vibrio parahaemolyticus]|uniref:hypothetical protein n=1 Tax=Vibrio parahaemolyticus TaxID=670 RepID=UPI0011200386|nr:hypothetical protein [Vibrio parahaemolyticus]TOH55926.1 hypothetical protein CGI77_21645 [Vibrio parahaemolyticus]